MKQELQDAQLLEQAIREQGAYDHVSVRFHRRALYVHAGSDDPIARLTPTALGQYGLHFHSHTGRWEPMPLSGKVPDIAKEIIEILGPYLERWN